MRKPTAPLDPSFAIPNAFGIPAGMAQAFPGMPFPGQAFPGMPFPAMGLPAMTLPNLPQVDLSAYMVANPEEFLRNMLR